MSDQEWARLEPHLPKNAGRGGRWKSHRRVINGILFRQRTGVPFNFSLPLAPGDAGVSGWIRTQCWRSSIARCVRASGPMGPEPG
uniref:transposase n=1 Tax=Streptomyces glebosus TaxID=249580 RepID=UPI00353081A5